MITSVMIASPGFACSPTYEHAFESEMINLLAELLNGMQKHSSVLKKTLKSPARLINVWLFTGESRWALS